MVIQGGLANNCGLKAAIQSSPILDKDGRKVHHLKSLFGNVAHCPDAMIVSREEKHYNI